MGIVAGSLGLTLSVAFTCLLALPFFVGHMNVRSTNVFSKLVLVCLVFIVLVFQLTAWSLMAKDIDDFRQDSGLSALCDHPPNVWSAALAFGLFGFIAVSLMFLIACAALAVEWIYGDDSASAPAYKHNGQQESGDGGRGHSYYGQHVAASRAEQQSSAHQGEDHNAQGVHEENHY